ncbi:MAG: hypothetical protein J1G06_08610 [Oscillospiraceae bacterium]|nr:hypothetical protein [Oscillospiraceae bacterium]
MNAEPWTEFETALYEVAKRQPKLNPVDYEQPYRYPNGTMRNKTYIKLHDEIFYCYKCGTIPIMQQNPQTKQYRAICPKCRIYATDGVQPDKHKAYVMWNEEMKRNLS